MSGYLLSIVGIVLLSGIFSAVLPEGKTVKFIKGITKLACLAVILAPVLVFFENKTGEGKINFPFFSSQTVIETDVSFIDYCSTKRIENAETELAKELEKAFSVQAEVTLLWEYESSPADSGNGCLAGYEGREIKIVKALLKTAEEEVSEEVRTKMAEHIVKEYGCEVEFIE